MTDAEPLTITNVTTDKTAGSKWLRGGYEYLFVFDLSRALTDSEKNSSSFSGTGLMISTHGPHRLVARLTEKELEANIDRYRAVLQEAEKESRNDEAASADAIRKLAEQKQQADEKLSDTLSRVNNTLKPQ
jgi:hypothetical protein